MLHGVDICTYHCLHHPHSLFSHFVDNSHNINHTFLSSLFKYNIQSNENSSSSHTSTARTFHAMLVQYSCNFSSYGIYDYYCVNSMMYIKGTGVLQMIKTTHQSKLQCDFKSLTHHKAMIVTSQDVTVTY